MLYDSDRRAFVPRSTRRSPARPLWAVGVRLSWAAALVVAGACGRYDAASESATKPASADQPVSGEHDHPAGPLGGAISSIGDDQYHAEAILQPDGGLSIFMLGQDVTRVQEVPQQQLTAYIRTRDSNRSTVILLTADPAVDDAPGRTSRFRGQLPEPLRDQPLYITIPGLRIGEDRFALRFIPPAESAPTMPLRVADAEAAELYLTAGGRYTAGDIEANGRTTASARYAGFRAQHDFSPAAGDRVCPISRTKANSQCSWVIGGETYWFCCPPCIDEFLALAKTQPDAILPAKAYVQQP